MLFKIKHITHYKYSSEVFLEPHLLRVAPRTDAYQVLKTFELEIFPLPTVKNANMGLTNPHDYMLWFEGNTKEFKIIATSMVEVMNANPFSFVIFPFTATQLPMRYSDTVNEQLIPCLKQITKDERVYKLAKELMLDIDFQTLPYVAHLSRYLQRNFKIEEVRPNSLPATPELTLDKKAGTHRDLAYLQMALCREAGIAARYVNGYYIDDSDKKYLHSWVEVYLPGAGWKGFDGTTGMAVGDRHIVITAGANPSLCALVTGTFRGNAHSDLETTIEITEMFS
ncbi:MAG: transglutaminase family protein [Cytophagales bacterium]|nr:MAG: transglutaminase family protein [Cytophagales bacterium]